MGRLASPTEESSLSLGFGLKPWTVEKPRLGGVQKKIEECVSSWISTPFHRRTRSTLWLINKASLMLHTSPNGTKPWCRNNPGPGRALEPPRKAFLAQLPEPWV